MLQALLTLLGAAGFSPTPAPLLGLQHGPHGHFNVTLGGKPWLSGGEVRVGAFCSSCSGANALTSSTPPVTSNGRDAIGEYVETRYTWAGQTGSPVIETAFRYYAHENGTIVFEQRFPKAVPLGDLRNDAHPTASEGAATLFPGFARNDGRPSDGLACAAYHGVFPQLKGCTVATYAASHQVRLTRLQL